MHKVTKKEVQEITSRVEQLLNQEFGNEYKVLYTRGSYGEYGRITLEFYKKDESGNFTTALEDDFRYYAKEYGLEPEDFGARFVRNGMTFEIVGLKPRNRKYPIIAKNVVTQDTFKFPAETVSFFKRSQARWTPANEVT